MRDASLAVIDAARAVHRPAHCVRGQAKLHRQRLEEVDWAKQGFERIGCRGQKLELEAEFMARAAAADNLPWMQLIENASGNAERNPTCWPEACIEWAYYGPDALNYAWSFAPLVERWDATEAAGETDSVIASCRPTEAFSAV